MKSAICGNTGKLKHATREEALVQRRQIGRATVFYCDACRSHHAAAIIARTSKVEAAS